MSLGILCEYIGCEKPATHYVVLRAWPAGELHLPKLAFEAAYRHPLLCKECAELVDLDVLLTVETWAFLNAAFLSRRKMPPTRDDVTFRIAEGAPPLNPILQN